MRKFGIGQADPRIDFACATRTRDARPRYCSRQAGVYKRPAWRQDDERRSFIVEDGVPGAQPA
jgi:hypothetical protein